MSRPIEEAKLNVLRYQADDKPSREHGQLYIVHCRVTFLGTARLHVQAEQTNNFLMSAIGTPESSETTPFIKLYKMLLHLPPGLTVSDLSKKILF